MAFSRASLEAMTVKDLKELCGERGLKKSGVKAEIVQRLLEHGGGCAPPRRPGGPPAAPAADSDDDGEDDEEATELHPDAGAVSYAKAHSAVAPGGRMYDELMDKWKEKKVLTRKQYRKIWERHGMPSAGMHVSHIIAESNGGAAHPDNYMMLGGKMNQRFSRFGDHLMCAVAGEELAIRAVEVSRRYGNERGLKYKGKSAELLFEEGIRAIQQLMMRDSSMQRPDPRRRGGGSIDDMVADMQRMGLNRGR